MEVKVLWYDGITTFEKVVRETDEFYYFSGESGRYYAHKKQCTVINTNDR